jgi:rod shape-determining protein MreD
VGAQFVTARSIVRVALVIFVVLMVQQTVMVALRIGGVHPDLLWLLPITAALADGPETGGIVGFWAGLAFDLVLPTPFGLSALVGCLLGFAVGSLTAAVDPRATWLKPVAAVAGSVAADMLFAVLGAIMGQQQMVQIDFLTLSLVVAVSSLVLVLPVNRLMRWALAGETNRRSLVSAQDSRLW